MVTLKDIAERCGVSVATVSKALSGAHDVGAKAAWNYGHREITFLHGTPCEETTARLESFLQSCAELGIKPTLVESKFHDIKTALELTCRLLAQPEAPSCIFYSDDLSLLGGFKATNRLGLHAPEDVSLVGFNGVAMSKRMSPTIFTSMPDSAGLGSQTVRLLLQAIEGSPEPPEHILVPGVIFAEQTLGKHK